MKIKEIIELWEMDKKQYVKTSTYSAYLLLIQNYILPFFGEREVVTESIVQDFALTKLKQGLSQKTIKDMIILLKTILKFGEKRNLIGHTIIEVKFPSIAENKDLEILSISDYKKLMKHLTDNFTFKNLGIYICLSTGMRIGEICGLLWSDVDVDSGVIRVRRTLQRVYIITKDKRYTEILLDTPKTKNSIRDIPMTTELLRIIRPLKKIVKDNYFVVTNDEKPIEPRTYRNYYRRLLKRVCIKYIKFHGLRHSFATRCIESRCDYKTLSVILGHSNIATTLNLYVHPNMDQKRKCVNKMIHFLK